ncbi:MAG TPA: hypothetical protein VIV12_23990 [Streptosporangiaceae bacterium]
MLTECARGLSEEAGSAGWAGGRADLVGRGPARGLTLRADGRAWRGGPVARPDLVGRSLAWLGGLARWPGRLTWLGGLTWWGRG